MKTPVIDLHCDLLAFLNKDRENNGPMDEASRCSLPLLEKGGVVFQTLAVFSELGVGSRKEAEGQIECYQQMIKKKTQSKTKFILAIESCCGLLEEEEPLDLLFDRFDQEKWLYVSLTWKEENRFGGGDQTKTGLKRDGEILLEYMDGKGISIDLSHTSDPLAEGILNHIDKKGLQIIPIASHSNFRAIIDHPRNLPDYLAKEIIARSGVIGINFVRHFVGNHPEDFLSHIHHGLALGGEDTLALGADFFGGIPLPSIEHLRPFYQESFSNSSCYQEFLRLLEGTFSQSQIQKLATLNANRLILQDVS
ncbi:MAG: membrane dipeptidase [Simkaniaceae bacterium]|nr:MAG: membrane dipeptidase [Simkaniaceae bacterium]